MKVSVGVRTEGRGSGLRSSVEADGSDEDEEGDVEYHEQTELEERVVCRVRHDVLCACHRPVA